MKPGIYPNRRAMWRGLGYAVLFSLIGWWALVLFITLASSWSGVE